MKLLIFGPQGCGKGTQAKLLSKELGIAHISVGELLRAQKGQIRKKIDVYMVAGKLIPNEITMKILKARLREKDCKRGFILDGFPRSLEQAQSLEKISDIDKAIEIDISDKEAVRRISGRVACVNCGEAFNYATMPPKKKGLCDKCGGKLVQREDDTREAVKKRLEIYHKETEPLFKRYKIIKVNGEKDIQRVHREIMQNLNK